MSRNQEWFLLIARSAAPTGLLILLGIGFPK
jgi:hypothetical protein